MGHIPDRRGRKARTAKMLSAQQMFETKREQSRANRADFRKKMREAPPHVQAAYRAFRRKIAETHKLKVPGAPKPIVVTLYDPERSSRVLTPIEVAWTCDLLSHKAQGWDVSLSQPLEDGAKPSIIFRLW